MNPDIWTWLGHVHDLASACVIYDTIEYNVHWIDTENSRDRIDTYS
jgi:hypothetical protein